MPLPIASFGPAGTCLEYAIYHSPSPFIRRLIDLGADLNPPAHLHAGFPPLIAALSKVTAAPGSPARPDVNDILKWLLAAGADPNQRGVNDWTPLHMAVAQRSPDAIRILIEGGADASLRTRIDDCLTPREAAEQAGLREIADLIGAHEARREGAQ
jgi:ankyrin repeat protein